MKELDRSKEDHQGFNGNNYYEGSRVTSILGRFEKDHLFEKIKQELCNGDIEFITNIETLVTFDEYESREYIEDFDEVEVFKELLEEERINDSSLYEEYLCGTSLTMAGNLKIILGGN
jgi:hypothetical protein